MSIHTETIDYQDGETTLEGFIAWDDSIKGPRPGVLVAHDWTGRRDFATGKAEEVSVQTREALEAAKTELARIEKQVALQVREKPLQALGFAAAAGFLAALVFRR